VKFSCEKCGKSYVADEKVRGRAFKMKCKQCGNLIVVKSAAVASPTPLPGSIPPASTPARSTTPPALELEGRADPFASTSADPFAPPAGDPFAVPSPDPFTPATSAARASFDPFVDLGGEDLGQEREVALLGALCDLGEAGGVGAHDRES